MQINIDNLKLDNLKEEFSINLPGTQADVISFDIYGVPPSHPENHLGYWNFRINENTALSVNFDFASFSFGSVNCTGRKCMVYFEDFWLNPEFIFTDKIKLSVVLWKNSQLQNVKEFIINIDQKQTEYLNKEIKNIKRLSENQQYINHFCKDEVPLPQVLIIESTSKCNMKCPMCPRTMDMSPSGEYRDLDESILPGLENAIKKANSVCLSWMGEPLVNRRLEEALKKIKEYNKDIFITMTSNGMLLTQDRAKSVIEAGLDSINISMDAADQAIYEKIRVGGKLEKVKDNIKNFIRIRNESGKERPLISIAYVGGETNIDQMPDMINMAEELSVKIVSFALIDDFTLANEFKGEVELPEEIKKRGREAFEKAQKLAEQKDRKIVFEMPIHFNKYLGIKKEGFDSEDILFENNLTDEEIKNKHLQKGCHIPWLHAFIAANGDVHPCCVSPTVLGNVKEQSFEAIWNGQKYTNFRKRLKSWKPNDECRNCRRAVWNRIEIEESLRDWMEVGRHETHGLGWTTIETDQKTGFKFRSIIKKATLFLRNSGKPYISMKFGNEWFDMTRIQIKINDIHAGYADIPIGWKTCVFKMPNEIKEKTLKVDIFLLSEKTILKASDCRLVTAGEISKQDRSAANYNTSLIYNDISRFIFKVKRKLKSYFS